MPTPAAVLKTSYREAIDFVPEALVALVPWKEKVE